MMKNHTVDHYRQRIINVEVVQKQKSRLPKEDLTPHLERYIQKYDLKDYHGGNIEIEVLQSNIESIRFYDDSNNHGLISVTDRVCTYHYHVFRLEDNGPELQELDEKEEEVPAATHWQLPSSEFHGLWDTLIYDSNVKKQLLNFVQTTMLFSDRGVNSNIISWNRVVLLHGPPGTGKTSLCKALAQKVAIRLNHRYTYAQLVEINSHSLFSKWFSESGKLVMKMFGRIQELVEDADCLVVVLIDEVESLARARQSGTSSNEPSDSVRVVNALLTQIDQIKRYPNVLILSTSNISGTIDLAFVDRADIKQYIGLPSAHAIYAIYYSCLKELIRTRLVENNELLRETPVPDLDDSCSEKSQNPSILLWKISQMSEGLSGRTLRKIPFLACSLFMEATDSTIISFLNAMEQSVKKQFDDRNLMPQS